MRNVPDESFTMPQSVYTPWMNGWNVMQDFVESKLKEVPQEHKILYFGHSAGAAFAQLAALFAATTRETTQSSLPEHDGEEAKRGKRLSRRPDFVIAIASPYVMTEIAVQKYETSVGCENTLHIKTKQDPILRFPWLRSKNKHLSLLKRPCDQQDSEIKFDAASMINGSPGAHRSEFHIKELVEYFKKKQTREQELFCCDPNRASK